MPIEPIFHELSTVPFPPLSADAGCTLTTVGVHGPVITRRGDSAGAARIPYGIHTKAPSEAEAVRTVPGADRRGEPAVEHVDRRARPPAQVGLAGLAEVAGHDGGRGFEIPVPGAAARASRRGGGARSSHALPAIASHALSFAAASSAAAAPFAVRNG